MNAQVLPTIVLFIFKVLILLGIAIYGVFAAVSVRQEQLMAKVFEESFEPMLRLMSVIHLVAVALLFFLAVIIL